MGRLHRASQEVPVIWLGCAARWGTPMASVSWSTATNGEWTVGSNWDSGTEPGTSDDVFIPVAGSYTVSLTAAVTVGSITIADTAAMLQIQDPGGDDVVTGNLDSSGSVGVDALGSGG